MNDDTQECGHCCQDNPPTATLCSFCSQPLNTLTQKEPTMGHTNPDTDGTEIRIPLDEV